MALALRLLAAALFFFAEAVAVGALEVAEPLLELLELLELLPDVFEPGVLLSSLGNSLIASPEMTLPFASYTVVETLVLVIATSLPLFGLGMPLSIRVWPPAGMVGTVKSVLKSPEVMSEGSHVGGCKDDAVAFPDSRSVTLRVAY